MDGTCWISAYHQRTFCSNRFSGASDMFFSRYIIQLDFEIDALSSRYPLSSLDPAREGRTTPAKLIVSDRVHTLTWWRAVNRSAKMKHSLLGGQTAWIMNLRAIYTWNRNWKLRLTRNSSQESRLVRLGKAKCVMWWRSHKKWQLSNMMKVTTLSAEECWAVAAIINHNTLRWVPGSFCFRAGGCWTGYDIERVFFFVWFPSTDQIHITA